MADEVDAELERRRLAYYMRIPPGQVGMDENNRSGMIASSGEVHLLIGDIAEAGHFSWAATAHASCVEAIPGDERLEVTNRRLVAVQNLALVEQGNLKYGSLSCGHTNMGLRCLAAGVASDDPRLSLDGRMNLAKQRARGHNLFDAAEGGLRWRVYRWPVRRWYPRALQLIVEARNSPGNIARRKSDAEGLGHIHQLASGSSAPDWAAIRLAVCRSKPPWQHMADEMCAFVAGKSGGVDGQRLAFCQA